MISFVVPAHDEERCLGAALSAIHRAAATLGEPWECVVVDDASRDATAAVAERAGARVVRVEHRQISRARNAGARAARGELLIFVDADTLVGAGAVRGAFAALKAGAAGGGAMVRFDEPLPLWASLLMPAVALLFRASGLAAGCFLFCTRPAFDAVGGFDETLFGAEEVVMSLALKRHGRFVVLGDTVVTSGRKVRAHSGWEIARTLGSLALGGWDAVRRRSGMEMWYGERRADPRPVGDDQAEAESESDVQGPSPSGRSKGAEP